MEAWSEVDAVHAMVAFGRSAFASIAGKLSSMLSDYAQLIVGRHEPWTLKKKLDLLLTTS